MIGIHIHCTWLHDLKYKNMLDKCIMHFDQIPHPGELTPISISLFISIAPESIIYICICYI